MSPHPLRPGTAREQIDRDAARRDSRREPSDPPSSHFDVDVRLESTAKRAGHAKAIIGAVVAFVVAVASGVAYLETRPSKADVAAAEARAVSAANAKNDQIADLSNRTVRVETKIDDMRAEETRRWDALDRILERNFGATTSATPPPTFGPAAKKQGRQ